eukprot:3436387-Amphidinium_carterae.1
MLAQTQLNAAFRKHVQTTSGPYPCKTYRAARRKQTTKSHKSTPNELKYHATPNELYYIIPYSLVSFKAVMCYDGLSRCTVACTARREKRGTEM